MQHPLIFFDGFCVLCNGFVDFIFKRDKKEVFRFASLQGKTAAAMRLGSVDDLNSLVYVDEAGCHIKSTAVLRILTRMGGAWRMFGAFFVIPRLVRDWVYSVVAEQRYRWFGKRGTCRLPQPEDRGRMLD